MSRALAAPLAHQLRDDAGLAFAGGVHRLQHGRLFDDAVLDQALWQAAEARARTRRALKKRCHSWTYGKQALAEKLSLPERICAQLSNPRRF